MSEKYSGKTGIIGGTFDPIHIGHLFLAEGAYEAAGLSVVLFMPSPSPYHRTDKAVSSLSHRVNMVKLAIADNPHFAFSDFEFTHSFGGNTADMLEAFRAENPSAEPYFIMGGDSLFSIESWRDPERVFANAVILASPREGEQDGESGSCGPRTQGSFFSQAEHLKEKYGARIVNLNTPAIGVSSSGIIKNIREGKTIKYHTVPGVVEYIYKNSLYI